MKGADRMIRGTLLRHPSNGNLVYSPDNWVDPAFAVNHPNGRYGFSLATPEQVKLFPSIPEFPGEYVELGKRIV